MSRPSTETVLSVLHRRRAELARDNEGDHVDICDETIRRVQAYEQMYDLLSQCLMAFQNTNVGAFSNGVSVEGSADEGEIRAGDFVARLSDFMRRIEPQRAQVLDDNDIPTSYSLDQRLRWMIKRLYLARRLMTWRIDAIDLGREMLDVAGKFMAEEANKIDGAEKVEES